MLEARLEKKTQACIQYIVTTIAQAGCDTKKTRIWVNYPSKYTTGLILLLLLLPQLTGCGESNTTFTPKPTNTTNISSAPTSNNPASLSPTPAPVTATSLAATTGPTPDSTPGTSVTYTGEGLNLDINGSQVMIKAGEGKTFRPDKPVYVTIWHEETKPLTDTLVTLLDEFEASNPNIRVILFDQNKVSNNTGLEQKLTKAAETHSLPDIAIGYEDWVPPFARSGLTLDLKRMIEGPYGLSLGDLQNYNPYILTRGLFPQFNNEIYTWAFSNIGTVLYYNEDLLNQYELKAPGPAFTWDDFVNDSKEVTVKSGGKVIGYVFNSSLISSFVAAVYSRGGIVFDSHSMKFVFDQKPALEHLSMLYDGVGRGYITLNDHGIPQDELIKFAHQQTAFYIGSSADRTAINALLAGNNDTISPFNWNAAIIPHAVGLKPTTSLNGTAAIAFKGKTEEENLATWEVLKFLGSKSFQSKWSIASSATPATQDVLDDPGYLDYLGKAPQNRIPLVITAYPAITDPKVEQWQLCRVIIQNEVNTLFQNPDGKVETTLKTIQDKCNAAIR